MLQSVMFEVSPTLKDLITENLPGLRIAAIKDKSFAISGLSKDWMTPPPSQLNMSPQPRKIVIQGLRHIQPSMLTHPKFSLRPIGQNVPHLSPIRPAMRWNIKSEAPFSLCIPVLRQFFQQKLRRRGLRKFSNDAMFLVSKACAEKLRHIIIECITLVGHRQESYTQNPNLIVTKNIRSCMSFLKSLEEVERDRKAAEERQVYLKAVKASNRNLGPEQEELKRKAKAFKEAEYEMALLNKANETALRASAPTKRKFSHLIKTEQADLVNVNHMQPRRKKICRRDLQYALENGQDFSKSLVLFRSYF
ncbi:TAF4B [Bugula neritina]|uniref:TAF4B n=1 Tax=Bugula neritina TaxID=10212 RepID=A0A7J7JTE6_BUGNE|nr:TAF4B [Bugula neritina]